MTKKKRYPIWFYIVPVLLPALILIMLEVSLRVLDYGKNYDTFIQISDDLPNLLFINPDLPFKYFTNLEKAPSVAPDAFAKEKTENSFRVFVLGGSSAAGWPYAPNASFPRRLKRKLQIYYPKSEIEVINLGMSAVNSYTVQDILPDVLDNQPDLILIYAGHNEYYGALGAGSTTNFGGSRALVKFILWLREFRITQLVQNVISGAAGLFSESDPGSKENNETLMARMIGENLIEFNSEEYLAGVKQFEENFDDIFSELKEAHIPVVVGTLTSNLMQIPLDAAAADKGAAYNTYRRAEEMLSSDPVNAKELFYSAKDQDAVRFRAPSKINKIIYNLAKKYEFPLTDIDSAFNYKSKYGITGFNLTVDHLHPNIEGYKLLADCFFQAMKKNDFLPYAQITNITESAADLILRSEFPFTELDSIIADIRIRILTGAYPFTPKNQPNLPLQEFKIQSFTDSLAAFVIERKISWKHAHELLADRFYNLQNFNSYIKEMRTIIADRPFDESAYYKIVKDLVAQFQYAAALPFVNKLHDLNPNDYTFKIKGIIALETGDYANAVLFLSEAARLNTKDAKILYNLSGAYYLNGDLEHAIETIKKCIQLKPDYKQAIEFYNGLKGLKIKGK